MIYVHAEMRRISLMVLFCTGLFIRHISINLYNSILKTIKTQMQMPFSLQSSRKSILITGGAGFIGHHLIMRLKQYNVSVVGVDNFNDYYDVSLKYKRSNISRVVQKVDVCDKNLMKEVLSANRITHVIHLAAQAGVRYSLVHPDVYVKSNIECFVQLLEILKNKNIPLIYASSSSVYGTNTKIPFSEKDPVNTPASVYGASKLADELVAYVYWNIYKQRSIGLRFFTVYGPLGRPDMAYYSFTENITKGLPVTVYNNGKLSRDFTYIDDIVDGLLQSLEAAFQYEIINLGRGEPQDLDTFITTIERFVGKKATLKFTDMAEGDVLNTYADISKAKRLLGYNPKISLQEGIQKFVRWYQSLTADNAI